MKAKMFFIFMIGISFCFVGCDSGQSDALLFKEVAKLQLEKNYVIDLIEKEVEKIQKNTTSITVCTVSGAITTCTEMYKATYNTVSGKFDITIISPAIESDTLPEIQLVY